MSKRNRLKKAAVVTAAEQPRQTQRLALGGRQFREFTGLDFAFGAKLSDYPPFSSIPEEFRQERTKANEAASQFFFSGGRLEDFDLRLKSGVDRAAFYGTLKALLSSFEPKHEHKMATCAWLISEFTEPTKALAK